MTVLAIGSTLHTAIGILVVVSSSVGLVTEIGIRYNICLYLHGQYDTSYLSERGAFEIQDSNCVLVLVKQLGFICYQLFSSVLFLLGGLTEEQCNVSSVYDSID